jgi:hypothetical protein
LKPLPDGCLGIIIKINLTTNYQLLLNCNKVHRAITTSTTWIVMVLIATLWQIPSITKEVLSPTKQKGNQQY